MLKASLSTQNTLGGPMVTCGHPCSFMNSGQNADIGCKTWITTHEIEEQCPEPIQEKRGSPQNNESDQSMEFKTTHWKIIDEEPLKSKNELLDSTKDGEISKADLSKSSTEITAEPVEVKLELIPVTSKTGEVKNSSEWKPAPSTKQLPTLQQSRKSYISRSVSLTEKELKDAQSISDDTSSTPLSPTQGSCSRGALLFHRRRQKLKALEEQKQKIPGFIETQSSQHTLCSEEIQGNRFQYGLKLTMSVTTESHVGSGRSETASNMEETSSEAGNAGDDLIGLEFPSVDKRAPSPSASEEDHQAPLSAYLKESLMVSATNGLINKAVEETVPTIKSERNGVQNKKYSEVHLTLSKPKSISNRTAKPFGTKSAKKNLSPTDKSPVIDLPPPTYAETLSSPPPVTRVRSPPAYSALYPAQAEHLTPVVKVVSRGETRLTPQPKTGILESIGARRGPKKSMFTFIEKPKMTPNPDLLSMVQTADERRTKPKGHGEITSEEEPFALGAEASNFQNNKTIRAGDNIDVTEKVADWSTCLKSPGVKAKPPPVPVQTLTEAKGKGAELFARRQSRMERFVVESPSPLDSARSPSPAMSLPPSWKYAANAQTPPPFTHTAKVNQRSPKPSSATPAANTASESLQSQKELEISKRQPYQLQSSLFIFSPTKDPVSSLPRAAPPPKPMVLESQRVVRQSSCPASPVVPSPTIYSPAYFNSIRSPPAMSPTTVNEAPTNYGRRTPTSHVSPMSPVPFSSTAVASPRTKTVIQAPRPSFSARSAGLESQRLRDLGTASPTSRALQHRGSLDGWGSSSVSSLPSYEEGSGMPTPPFRSMSPSWSDRSPSPFKAENDLRAGKQMKALIARNIINAAKRKSASPWGLVSPQSPLQSSGIWSPKFGNGTPLPETPRSRRSPTGSEISLESEDSGAKSPGFRSYTMSPKGWYGSMRQKRDSLPNNSAFTYTP
ncbi:synaptopodin [Rhinophrynus dorsalis]